MAKITYITSQDFIDGKTGITAMPGYCLVEMKSVYITHPTDVMGSLFTCPCCGLIDDQEKTDHHVFNPSAPLITALEMGKS